MILENKIKSVDEVGFPVHFGFVADKEYLPHLPKLIRCLLSHTHSTDVTIHILRIDAAEVEHIWLEQLDSARLTIKFYDVSLKDYEASMGLNSITLPERYRYTLGKVLLLELADCKGRLLYLDIDVRVRGSIDGIWQLCPSATIACVADAGMARLRSRGDPDWRVYRASVGAEGEGEYFNSGVMLVNVGRWKAENCTNDFKTIAKSNAADWRFGDQSILNLQFSKRWMRLPEIYNCQMTLHRNFQFSEAFIRRVSRSSIIHFSGSPKPWQTKHLLSRLKGTMPEHLDADSVARLVLRDQNNQWRQYTRRKATSREVSQGQKRFCRKKRLHTMGDDRFDNAVHKQAFIIGAMKAGTTSLFEWLSDHAQVCASATKEPEYFSEFQPHGLRLKQYSDAYDFDPGIHKLRLEASTGYSKYPVEKGVAERIHAHLPNSKFIFIVRDPLERAYSQAAFQSLRYGRDHKLDISECLSLSMYNTQLAPYELRFGPENINIVDFAELCRDPAETAYRVCSWLDLDAARLNSDYEIANASNYGIDHSYKEHISQYFKDRRADILKEVQLFSEKWKFDVRKWRSFWEAIE